MSLFSLFAFQKYQNQPQIKPWCLVDSPLSADLRTVTPSLPESISSQ